MDFILFMLDEKSDAVASLPHGERSRFHTETEAVARAEELRGEAAALGDKKLPAFAVMMESTGERVREIKDSDEIRREDEDSPVVISRAALRELLKCADGITYEDAPELLRTAIREANEILGGY